MRISVTPDKNKIVIAFEGNTNMSQNVTITNDDALLLRELLATEEGGSFETD